MPMPLPISLCLLAAALPVGAPDARQLPGHWHGHGRYYEVKLLRQLPPPQFDLVIGADLTLSGKVGAAHILPAKPIKVGTRIDYHVVLAGRIGADELIGHKDHLLILITRVDGNTLSADFHLKSWFGFDVTMHPGSLEAARLERR